jgi:acetyltransferase
MNRIFYPDSIVVIGVSDRPDNLAKNIVGNLISFNFEGPIYAVGRSKGNVHGIEIHDSLAGVPDNVDLGVILTPAHLVPMFVDQCGTKGIHRVVVESGGFSEFSQKGAEYEKELLEQIQKHQMRMVGPNCISVVNLESGVCLPFGVIPPNRFKLGNTSIIAQSGGVSLTFMGMFSSAGVGVNKAVSIGNKSDLDESDYLEYFLSDPGTETVCMYLESISDGRRLFNIAAEATKPIVIHKANRSSASQEVAFSHTAALAGDDRVVEAAFSQAGIIRADDFDDMQSIAKGLTLPAVKGNDLLVISRSGGHAVTAADLAERHGFKLPPLPDSYSNAVRDLFAADVISLTNPLDLGVIYDIEIYAQIVEGSLESLSPDAVLLINTYGATQNESGLKLAKRVGEIVRDKRLPIALCLYADMADPSAVQDQLGYPIYEDIDAALRGLATSRDWHNRSTIDSHKSTIKIDQAVADEGTTATSVSLEQSLGMCEQIGIPIARSELSVTKTGAIEAAEQIGFPVALKLISAELTHKSDFGALVLNLMNSQQVADQLGELTLSVKSKISPNAEISYLIQEMIPSGVELLVGGKVDPIFGPIVSFGIGGIHVEIYDDVSIRLAPLTEADAAAMIEEVQGSKLLDGYRGAPAVNRSGIIQALLSISNMFIENRAVWDFEINPLIASDNSVIAVDARGLLLPSAGSDPLLRI